MHPYIKILGKTFGTYGICIGLAVVLVAALSTLRGKKKGLLFEDIAIVGGVTMGLALLCGSLLYILVTYPMDMILSQIADGSFAFLNGGIVFYGGLIGGVAGAFLGVRIAKCDMTVLEYAVVPLIPLGHAIGRVGCVMAGCCYGVEYEGPLALYYPHSLAGVSPQQGYFPVQPLESVLNLVICLILLLFTKKERRRFDVLALYAGCYGVARLILELFRGDTARGIYFGLSVSQWISLGMILTAAVWFVLLRKVHKKPHLAL